MMRRCARLALVGVCGLLSLVAGPADATPTRFALIIGNDVADTGRDGPDLGALRFAERDALRLQESLVRYGQFAPDAVEVVIGGGRSAILSAAARLAERHRAARAQLGEVPTLFALFFNGHGLDGRLLTARGALSGDDVGDIIEGVGATLAFALFDACHSGAVDLDSLKAKGVVSTPGFNPAKVVPKELLTSAGLLWFSSSGPDEISFEDPAVGSLFTHYFIEAFTAAERDPTGIELDDMWSYARARTAQHAARHGRTQSPVRQIESLRSSGPLYFSFPNPRSATVIFAEPIAGVFAVRSAGGLVERVSKAPGDRLELAVYPGELRIGPVDGPPLWGVDVGPGERVSLEARAAPTRPPPGYEWRYYRAKGPTDGRALARRSPATTTQLGLGATWLPPAEFERLPDGRIELVGQWTNGPWAVDGRLGYAFGQRTFDAWGAEMHGGSAAIGLAFGVAWQRLRLDVRGGLDADVLHTGFTSSEPDVDRRTTLDVIPGLGLSGRASQAIDGVVVGLSLGARAAWANDLPPDSDGRALRVGPAVSLDLTWR